MTWTPSSKTQKQRSAETKRKDKADAMACAERAESRCEVCGIHVTHDQGGSMHHSRHKQTAEIRHNRDLHIWLCFICHRHAHDDPAKYADRITAIIEERTNA